MTGNPMDERDFISLLESNQDMIDRIGDCPNLEIKADPNSLFWNTVETIGDWKLQRSRLRNKARIVGPDGKVKANGTRSIMREKMRRLMREEFLQPGDVVGVSRAGLYEHYAVYIGDGRVIHYAGEGNDFSGRILVHEASFADFIKNATNYFVVYFDGTKPFKIQSSKNFVFNSVIDYYPEQFQNRNWQTYSDEETVKRAVSRIGEERYSLISNNCEHFAIWCKTGISDSSQVRSVVQYALSAGISLADLMEDRGDLTAFLERQ